MALRVLTEVTAGVEIGQSEVIDRVANQWEQLCEETRSVPFYRPEFISSYIQSFEPESRIVLLTAYAGDHLVAVLPMVQKPCIFAGVPLMKWVGAANVHSSRFDILRSADAAGEAGIQAIWSLLKQTPGWQLLELPYILEDGNCAELLSQAKEEGYRTWTQLIHESPVLRLQPDTEGSLNWLAGTSRHFRHELRRFARVLESETGAKPVFTRQDYPDPVAMQRFLNMEAAGWKGEQGSAIQCERNTSVFYDLIARQGATRGYFCLHSLEVNGELAAGAISLSSRKCFFPLKIAMNEKLRRCGPGHLLINSILQDCAENRIPELLFGGERDSYKSLWTKDVLPHFTGMIFAPDIRARIAYHSRTGILPILGKVRRSLRVQFGQKDTKRGS